MSGISAVPLGSLIGAGNGADSDSLAVSQVPGGGTLSDPLKRMTLEQLAEYILAKLPADAAPPTLFATGFTFADPPGTATLADSPTGIVLKDVGLGGVNVSRSVCKAAPTPPYTVTAKIAMTQSFDGLNNDQWAGVTWRNTGPSNGAPLIMAGLVMWGSQVGVNLPGFTANNFTNANTFAGTSSTGGNIMPWYDTEFWCQLRDDGTNVTWSYGRDGASFYPLFSGPKSAGFLGATGYNQICFFINPKGNGTTAVLESYKETSP
jgi:hypothetical protein